MRLSIIYIVAAGPLAKALPTLVVPDGTDALGVGPSNVLVRRARTGRQPHIAGGIRDRPRLFEKKEKDVPTTGGVASDSGDGPGLEEQTEPNKFFPNLDEVGALDGPKFPVPRDFLL